MSFQSNSLLQIYAIYDLGICYLSSEMRFKSLTRLRIEGLEVLKTRKLK